MKKIIANLNFVLIATLAFTTNIYSQNAASNSTEIGGIALNAYIPEQIEGIPEIANNMLTNKLNQIISTNGVTNSSYNSRFIITANATVLTKDVLATAPPMHAITLDVTLYIGDGFEGKKFASQTVTVKGVGINENKAYIDAFKNVKQNDPALLAFITKGKAKIIEYYNATCAQNIKEAQNLGTQNLYEEAVFKLISVPVECTACYDKSMVSLAPIFKKKIDRDCVIKLAEANNLWNGGQDVQTANNVGEILMSIDPKAACFNEAKALSNKVGKRVLELDKREWNYKLETEVNLQRDAIKAYRDVGVAYGKGQPKSVTYNVSGWW
jgi:predicted NAD-dependent protein-ADP-ribosyltransferase YbiA (DUF1768 family)